MARYELLDRIGVGAMAEIFRAKAIAGGGFEKPVAIKRILPRLSEDQRFIELLIAEAKILSELHHRNIVQIYDVGLGDDGQYFLVIEYVDGMDLASLYERIFPRNPLPQEVALHICSELCEALEYAHRATDETGQGLGLVHRDVSPSNVLLSKSGEVKLTDFGIAKRVEEVTGYGGVRGKFGYISPEQARNERVDQRSDVYSVGILLYELVCQHRLFSSMQDFDALRAVRNGKIPRPPESFDHLAPELAGIVSKALSADPAERFQSAGEFGSALRTYRYSLREGIADPGAEIADLVTRDDESESRPDSYSDFDSAGEKTVVNIDTAAEFRVSELSGFHKVVASYPTPQLGEIHKEGSFEEEDEETVMDGAAKALVDARTVNLAGSRADDASLSMISTKRMRKKPATSASFGDEDQATATVADAPGPDSFETVRKASDGATPSADVSVPGMPGVGYAANVPPRNPAPLPPPTRASRPSEAISAIPAAGSAAPALVYGGASSSEGSAPTDPRLAPTVVSGNAKDLGVPSQSAPAGTPVASVGVTGPVASQWADYKAAQKKRQLLWIAAVVLGLAAFSIAANLLSDDPSPAASEEAIDAGIDAAEAEMVFDADAAPPVLLDAGVADSQPAEAIRPEPKPKPKRKKRRKKRRRRKKRQR